MYNHGDRLKYRMSDDEIMPVFVVQHTSMGLWVSGHSKDETGIEVIESRVSRLGLSPKDHDLQGIE